MICVFTTGPNDLSAVEFCDCRGQAGTVMGAETTLLTTLQRSLRLLDLTDMPDLNAGADRLGWRRQRCSSAVD